MYRSSTRVGGLLVSLGLLTFGIGLSEPVTPIYAVELGANTFSASLVVSLRWATRLVVNIPAGMLSRRLGRKPIFLFGIAAMAFGALGAALAKNWHILLLTRVLEGLGSGVSMTVILTMLTELGDAQPARRGALYGHYQTIHRLGFWIGPAVGALVLSGPGARTAIWIFFAVCVCAMISSVFFVKDPLDRRLSLSLNPPSPRMKELTELMTNRRFVTGSLLMAAAFFTLTGAQFTALPLLVLEDPEMVEGTLAATLFAINAVGFALIYPSAWLSDRIGRPVVLLGLGCLATLGLLFIAIASGIWVVAAGLAVGGATALRGPPLLAYTLESRGRSDAGISAGVMRGFGDLWAALGPLMAGLTVSLLGSRGFFLVNSALFAIVLLVLLSTEKNLQ